MTTAATPLRIVGYVRVSTNKQDISPEVRAFGISRETLYQYLGQAVLQPN